MLSIAKLGSGAEEYYLGVVASGREDYYTRSGEAPGVWLGDGAARLGLRGTVSPDDLRAVLAGRHPGDGTALVKLRAKRVSGFDLTFSAPKSVSVLWALGSEQTAQVVRVAHDKAVEESASYLSAHALCARRGHDGVEPIATTGFVAAAFGHRTSRAADPQLHTHLLVANVVEGVDRHWSAPDARLIYTHATTASYVYQASLRAHLSESLGVRFGPVRRGVAEVAGVPDEVVSHFSTRRHEIEAALNERGLHGARAAEVAALATRSRKESSLSTSTLRDMWAERTRSLGVEPSLVEGLVGGPRLALAYPDLAERWCDEMVAPTGLTAAKSTFEPRDVMRAAAERFAQGAHLGRLEQLCASALLHPDVLRLGRSGPGAEGELTTSELLATERRLVETAWDRRERGAGVVDGDVLRQTLAGNDSLSNEQRRMIERLVAGGHGVDVVVGRAGAGKTTALAAAREAWERDNYRVRGTTLSARAARQLEEGAGIESATLASFSAKLASGEIELSRRDVVIVDEAGMVGTRALSALVDRTAAADAKVVLVGDPRQLPEIEAGGAFGAIARVMDAPELTENRRQQGWEPASLAELRHGDVGRALADYERHDRLHVARDPTSARQEMVVAWYEARAERVTVRMLATTGREVDALNHEARRVLFARGELGDVMAHANGQEFRLGDAAICTRNDRELDVLNGTRGVVVGRGRAGGVVIEVGDDHIDISSDYLGNGYLRYGYATTIYKSQGETVDRAFVLADTALFREAGYVAMSRARRRTDLYWGEAATREGLDQPAESDLTRTLSMSRAKDLAGEGPSTAGNTRQLERVHEGPDLGLGW